jgi:hypothetical protein
VYCIRQQNIFTVITETNEAAVEAASVASQVIMNKQKSFT